MSKLSQLQGKSKTYKIGEIVLELKPLKLDDMNLFVIDQNASLEEQKIEALKLIKKTLMESVPDATEEEINDIGINHMESLQAAIMDVNGLKDQKGSALDAIKARQAQIQVAGK